MARRLTQALERRPETRRAAAVAGPGRLRAVADLHATPLAPDRLLEHAGRTGPGARAGNGQQIRATRSRLPVHDQVAVACQRGRDRDRRPRRAARPVLLRAARTRHAHCATCTSARSARRGDQRSRPWHSVTEVQQLLQVPSCGHIGEVWLEELLRQISGFPLRDAVSVRSGERVDAPQDRDAWCP